MFGQQRGSIPCTQEERRESLSSKGAQSGLAVPLLFPWKERTGCLWTCRGGNGLFPVPGSGHGPFLRKKKGAALCCGGGCGGGCLGGGEGRFSAPRRNAGRPSLLKGHNPVWRCPLPFPWKGGTGCLWTCRGGNGLFPVPGSGHGPSCRKRGRQPSAVEEGGCGGGCLGSEGDRFSSYLGRSPLKGATRFGDTISAFLEKGAERPSVRWGTGGPLPAGSSGTSGFGGATPLPPEKEGARSPRAGRRGHLSRRPARRRATLSAGQAVAPAKRAGGITAFSTVGGLSPRGGGGRREKPVCKSRARRGCAGGATVCHPISHAVFGLSIPFFPTCATVPPMKRGI